MQKLSLLGLTLLLAQVIELRLHAAKPVAVNEEGALEVRIDGPLYSLPDYTGQVRPDFESDICRTTTFKGNGDLAVALRKTMLWIPFQVGTCWSPGFYRRAVELQFASNPAAVGAAVRVRSFLDKNYEMAVMGQITSGQWPPAPGGLLVVRIPAGSLWQFTPYGGVSKNCKVTRTLTEDVFVYAFRNPNRTADACDCPFTYTDDDFDGIADECE